MAKSVSKLFSFCKHCLFTVKKCRLDRPIGTVLLLLPCLWGYVWQSTYLRFWDFFLLTVGALWMRSIGCAYNDWIDQDLDCFVHRTRARGSWNGNPLQTLCLASILSLPGLFLGYYLPLRTMIWGILGWTLSLAYPFLKRWIFGPQIFLGILFSWGVWVGASLSLTPFSKDLIFFFILGILWTIEYDTVYAYQDQKDDEKLGLKSLALWWGPKGKHYLMMGLGIRLLMLGWWSNNEISYLLLGSYGLCWGYKLHHLDLERNQSLSAFFHQSWITGTVILLFIFFNKRI